MEAGREGLALLEFRIIGGTGPTDHRLPAGLCSPGLRRSCTPMVPTDQWYRAYGPMVRANDADQRYRAYGTMIRTNGTDQ
jgi:hypothetical protein